VTVSAPVSQSDLLAWAQAHAPEPAAAPKAVHVVETLPTTSVGKLFKPELVADTVRRIIAGLSPGAAAEVVLEDGQPVALIGPDTELAAALGGYPIRYRVESL
jgi:fatty-acyl-CoA synthase